MNSQNKSLNVSSHNHRTGQDTDESMVVIKSALDDSSSAYSQAAKRENRKQDAVFSYQLAMSQ